VVVVIGALGDLHERPVGKRRAHGLALTPIVFGATPVVAVEARRLDVLLTELARAVRVREGGQDPVTLADGLDVAPDVFDDAHPFVAGAPAGLHALASPR